MVFILLQKIVPRIVSYDEIKHDAHILKGIGEGMDGIKEINLSLMKKNMIIITMNKNELYVTMKYTFTVSTAFRAYTDMRKDNDVSSSGVVILLIASQKRYKRAARADSKIIWGD